MKKGCPRGPNLLWYRRRTLICSRCNYGYVFSNAQTLSKHARGVHGMDGIKVIPQTKEERDAVKRACTMVWRAVARDIAAKKAAEINALSSQIMVIIGGFSGIGRQVVQICAQQNIEVIALTRYGPRDGKSDNPNVTYVPIDLNNNTTFSGAMEKIDEILRGRKISLLVANSGITSSSTGSRVREVVSREIIEVNLIGLVKVTQLLLPRISSGRVVMVSSNAGAGSNVPGEVRYAVTTQKELTVDDLFSIALSQADKVSINGAYILSKYLLNAATEILAKSSNVSEEGEGTTYINSVDPGSIKSGMNLEASTKPEIGAMNIIDVFGKDTHGLFYSRGGQAEWK